MMGGRKKMPEILMIDDQLFFYELATDELADEGYQWRNAGTSDEAFAYLSEQQPDLILLDPYFQGFEGWDLLRHIQERHPDIPLIIHTAYDTFRDHPRVKKAEGYVLKAPDMTRLRERIRAIL